jgi:tRNA-dihydrouridine synthase
LDETKNDILDIQNRQSRKKILIRKEVLAAQKKAREEIDLFYIKEKLKEYKASPKGKEYSRQYYKKYYSDPENILKHKERLKKYQKKYYSTIEGKKKIREAQKRYREKKKQMEKQIRNIEQTKL